MSFHLYFKLIVPSQFANTYFIPNNNCYLASYSNNKLLPLIDTCHY